MNILTGEHGFLRLTQSPSASRK